MYQIAIERQAERDLDRLPERLFRLIIPRIQALAQDPRPAGCRKLSGSQRDWRIRVGDYRVVYEIVESGEACADHARPAQEGSLSVTLRLEASEDRIIALRRALARI